MFSKLPKEVKELVVRGVYSLFELKNPIDGFNFILIKSDDTGLLLNKDGNNVKAVTNVDTIELGKMLTFNDISVPDSVAAHNTL